MLVLEAAYDHTKSPVSHDEVLGHVNSTLSAEQRSRDRADPLTVHNVFNKMIIELSILNSYAEGASMSEPQRDVLCSGLGRSRSTTHE